MLLSATSQAGFVNQLLVCLCFLMSQRFRFTIVERQAKCLHVGDPESDGCQILSCNALSEVDELHKS